MFQAIVRSHSYARIAMSAVLALATLHINAFGQSGSCAPQNEDGPQFEHAAERIVSESQAKRQFARKYDVTRIAQRNIGKGLNLYSLNRERSLGGAKAADVDKQTKFVDQPHIKDYISRLAQKIVRKSDSQIPFAIKVIDSKNASIFSLPGGFLYVDAALLLDVDNEAELAGLMAHEIAHVAARHATRSATRSSLLDLLLALPVERIIGPAAIGVRQFGLVPFERKFNRASEFEADLLGVEYQYAAGYDPQAYIEALEKLDNQESHQPKLGFWHHLSHRVDQAYSYYPPTELRIERLQEEIATLLPCRDYYVLDTNEFQDAKAQLAADRLVLHRRRAEDSESKGVILQRHPSSE